MNSEPNRRLTIRFVWAEILAFLSWEKGAPYTAVRLLVRPGKTIHSYLDGQRERLTNPIRFLLMACAAVTAAFVFFMPPAAYFDENSLPELKSGWESVPPELVKKVADANAILNEILEETDEVFLQKNAQHALDALNKSFVSQFGEITLTWMNVFLLLAMPLNSFISWLFLRRAQLNLAEHVAANSYILGIQNLASLALVPLAILEWGSTNVTTGIYMLLSFIYQFIAWKQVFQLRGLVQYAIGIFALLLSVIGFIVLQGIATALIYGLTA